MRAIIQRTDGAELHIDGLRNSKTGKGLLILFGTREGDGDASLNKFADKIVNLRIFEDSDGKMNLSAIDIGADLMVVSQFTLYADTRKGRRPSFNTAQNPDDAEVLYEKFVAELKKFGLKVETGVFGTKMDIRFNNNGPVTIILDNEI